MDTSDDRIEFDAQGRSNHAVDFLTNIKPNGTLMINLSSLSKIVSKTKSDGKGRDFDAFGS